MFSIMSLHILMSIIDLSQGQVATILCKCDCYWVKFDWNPVFDIAIIGFMKSKKDLCDSLTAFFPSFQGFTWTTWLSLMFTNAFFASSCLCWSFTELSHFCPLGCNHLLSMVTIILCNCNGEYIWLNPSLVLLTWPLRMECLFDQPVILVYLPLYFFLDQYDWG